MAREKTIPKTVEEALGYFLGHPEASDTLEGIVRWRLLDQRISQTVDSVDQALRWLVAQGFLLEVATLSGPPLFTLNPDRIAAARELLTGLQSGNPEAD